MAVIALFGLLSVLSIFICTGIGSVKFSVSEVARALFVDDESTARLLIWNLRFPRVLVGGLVGICLSLSGCILQGVMRNNDGFSLDHRRHRRRELHRLSHAGGRFRLTRICCPIGSIVGRLRDDDAHLCACVSEGRFSPVKMILSGMAVSALFSAFNDIIKDAFSPSRSGTPPAFSSAA